MPRGFRVCSLWRSPGVPGLPASRSFRDADWLAENSSVEVWGFRVWGVQVESLQRRGFQVEDLGL